MSQEELQRWIADRLEVSEEQGTPVLFGLAHLTTSNDEVPVCAIKVGQPIWGNAAKMAEAFEANATRYARGVMGHVQYRLGAVYKDSPRPLLTLPFLKAGASNIGGGLGIDPSPLGQNMQGQRILDEMAMGVLAERRDVVNVLMQTNRMLSDHVLRANEDVQKTRIAFFELEEKVRNSQHAAKLAELAFHRNTMLLTEGSKYMPMMVNQITGKKWIPEAIESKSFEEQWLDSHTPAEMAAEIERQQVRNPAFAAFLIGRLAEVQKRKVDEEKLRKKMGGEAPTPEGSAKTSGHAPPSPTDAEAEATGEAAGAPVGEKVPDGPLKPDIDIVQAHSLPLPALRFGIEMLVVKMSERIQVGYEWTGNRLSFANESGGFTGAVDIAPDKVRVRVVLQGMVMKAMRGTVESQLVEALTAAINKTA